MRSSNDFLTKPFAVTVPQQQSKILYFATLSGAIKKASSFDTCVRVRNAANNSADIIWSTEALSYHVGGKNYRGGGGASK